MTEWMVGRTVRPGTPQFDRLVEHVIWQESKGDPTAVSEAGAAGLMQVMPNTAADPGYGVRPMDWSQRFDPAENRRFGTEYLGAMLRNFNGDVNRALVAYNAGPGTASRWDGNPHSLPRETQGYLRNIGTAFNASLNGDDQRMAQGTSEVESTFDWTPHRTQGGLREDAISGLDAGFRGSLEQMIMAAPDEIRSGLQVYSGYRSIERQQELWDAALQRYGSEAEARRWVAPPGRSQHNHGNAVDLMWNGQRLDRAPAHVRDWVHSNAAQFGMHFPMGHEPWHIEPIGARNGQAGTTPRGGNTSPASGPQNFTSPAASEFDARKAAFEANMQSLANARRQAAETKFSQPGLQMNRNQTSVTSAQTARPTQGVQLGNIFN